MNLMTKKAIEKLLKEMNHSLKVDDFDLIGDLDKIADRVVGILDGHERTVIFPVEVGSISLYPLTIAKSEMVRENDLDEIEFIYLLSLQNDKPSLPDAKTLRKEAKKLVKRLTCTEVELSKAIDKVIALSSNTSNSDRNTDYPQVIDLLCSEYGSSPEYWLYEESMELIGNLIDRLVMRKHQQAPKENKGAPPPSLKIKSLYEFRQQVKRIREAWQENQ